MGFKEDLMKQYRQWKEDPTPFLKGEVVIFEIIEENEKIEELKSQLEKQKNNLYHISDDLCFVKDSTLKETMESDITRYLKQLEGLE